MSIWLAKVGTSAPYLCQAGSRRPSTHGSGPLDSKMANYSAVCAEPANVGLRALPKRLVWHVVKQYAAELGLRAVAPHDLRRSCAKLCHAAGGELEQVQFLLGPVSVQTTERYLGCKQRIRGAVNDRIGIEPSTARGSGYIDDYPSEWIAFRDCISENWLNNARP